MIELEWERMEGEGTLSISVDKDGVCRWRFYHHYEKVVREEGENSGPLRKATTNLWLTYRNGFLSEVKALGTVYWPSSERPQRFLGVPVSEAPPFRYELSYRHSADQEFLLHTVKTDLQESPVRVLDPVKAVVGSAFPLVNWGFVLGGRGVYKFRYINSQHGSSWFEFPPDIRRVKRLGVGDV